MTYYNDGTFSAEWNGSNDFLARVGLKYNSTQTHDQIGYFTADYKFTKSGSAAYSYIGIYGWTENPLVDSANLQIYLSDVSMQPNLVTFLESIDGVRESIVTSSRVMIGNVANIMEPDEKGTAALEVLRPLLTNREMAVIKNLQTDKLRAVTLSMLYPVNGGAEAM